MPIVLPLGTNGATPSLSLVYNSSNPSGHLGMGWALSGLSIITRDGHRKIFEGDMTNVKMDNTDAFSLDGEHLKPISGSNGENNTIYDTYMTQFAKITSFTSNNAKGPEWFQVITKDNIIMEYGKTTNARVATVGTNAGKVGLWQLNKVTDAFGNYTEFVYGVTVTGAGGLAYSEPRILEIRYTGNASQNLTPYNKITFDYDTRTDKNESYLPDIVMPQSLLMTKINVWHNSSIMREYAIKYGYTNGASFLNEIQETAYDDKRNVS